MIDLALLRHFIAVAQANSFTGAAQKMAVSRPVITKSIQRLEQEVGTKLFDRTTRSVNITAAGSVLLGGALEMVEKMESAIDNARQTGKHEKDIFKIGLCDSVEPALGGIARSVQAFRSAQPRMDIQFVFRMRNVQGRALRSGEIDVGYTLLNRSDCEGLRWHVLARAPLMIWLPPSWGIDEPTIRPDRLRDRPWILASPSISPDLYALQMSLCRSAGFEPRYVTHADDRFAEEMMRACQQGATFLHQWDAPRGHPCVKEIEGVSPDFCSELVIAWAADATHVEELVRGTLATDAEIAAG